MTVVVPTAATGGTNPAQIGLGSRLAGTVQQFTQGAIQRTGRTTDIAIQGDGFFVVNNGTENLYTRAGSFTLDATGNLTTPDGMLVQGWQADGTGVINTNAGITPVKIRVGELQGIQPQPGLAESARDLVNRGLSNQMEMQRVLGL